MDRDPAHPLRQPSRSLPRPRPRRWGAAIELLVHRQRRDEAEEALRWGDDEGEPRSPGNDDGFRVRR